MKTSNIFIKIAFFSILFFVTVSAQKTSDNVYKTQLKLLEETWNVLDQVSAKAWPGWTGYTDVPFLFRFANGVQMLVGHPNPPEGFVLNEGFKIRDKKVYLNRNKEIQMEMKPPISGGGGPIPYGNYNNKSVLVVDLSVSGNKVGGDENSPSGDVKTPRYESENQILINLHELFHCYQRLIYKWRYGNLQYNTDANYSTYAEIEGIALERAYLEKDDNKAKEYLKDFIVARELKRKSMAIAEQNQESEEEIMEGGAVHAEIRACELLKESYKPVIAKEDDSYFNNFINVDSLIAGKLKMLRNARKFTMDARNKSYSFGAFQAVLLNRFTPGWQEQFYQKGFFFDQLIKDYLKLTDDEKKIIEKRLKTNYDYAGICQKHSELIDKRDNAYKLVAGRKGITVVVNFKNTFEFPSPQPSKDYYRLGIISVFPEGFGKLNMEEIEMTSTGSPVTLEQLYHFKWVDTESKLQNDCYKITYDKKEGDDIYCDAVVTTGGFILKAPKIQIVERAGLVKIIILSKVKV